MNWIALRMLTGDRAKYLGLIFGVTFATFLMSQQVSVFMGILTRTGNAILDVRDADIWVMDNRVRFIDEAPGLQNTDLLRVRGVEGVTWAVRLYRGNVLARLEDGNTRDVRLTGIDDETFVGAPQKMLLGRVADLKKPDAVIIDKAGYEFMWGKEPYRLGRTFQINDRRAVLVGVCDVGPPFFSVPIVYSRYSQAANYAPRERMLMNYILVKAARRCGPCGIVPSNPRAYRADGAHWPGVLLEDDSLLFGLDGHSCQLWGYHRFGIRRRCGRDGTDAISIHSGRSQTIRRAEGDGGRQPEYSANDFVASAAGRWHRLRTWNRNERNLFHVDCQHDPTCRPAHDLGCRAGHRNLRTVNRHCHQHHRRARVLVLEPAIVFRG